MRFLDVYSLFFSRSKAARGARTSSIPCKLFTFKNNVTIYIYTKYKVLDSPKT